MKRNDWPTFLNELARHDEVTLIGPMSHQAHSSSTPTVFVDGGHRWRSLDPTNLPEISIGDGDSLEPTGFGSLDVRLPAEKDESDFAFVMRHLPPSIRRVQLIGFLGGRLDHQLINIGETHRYLSGVRDMTVCTFDGGEVIAAGGVGFFQSFSTSVSGIFSLIVVVPTQVKLTGACKYQLAQPTIVQPLTSLGLSNVGYGEISIQADGPFFLLRSQG